VNDWGNGPAPGPAQGPITGPTGPAYPPSGQPPAGPGTWSGPAVGPPPGPVGYVWPEPPRSSNLSAVLAGVVLLAIVGVVLVAAIGFGGGLGTVFNATSMQNLKLGQCFNGSRPDPSAAGTKMVGSVDVVACTEPHDGELIATSDYPAAANASYPGDDEVSEYAEGRCSSEFLGYVGTTSERTHYEMTYFVPFAFNWAADDRSVQCVVHPPAGQATMTGSVRNSRR
jgi:hypothetical protein